MNSINTASLINLLGFAVGVALYALLLVMVFRHRRRNAKIDTLLFLTGILGILWNAGELFAFTWQDFVQTPIPPVLIAVSFSALGFLPTVVVHSAESEKKDSRILTIAAYGISGFAALLHFQSALFYGLAPSNLALQILTFGSIALVFGLLIYNFRQKFENKTVWIAALLIFAVSALHLSSKTEESFWPVELIAHQSSLPLVLAILFQDYRFAFADLFLKRALSLLLLALTAFGLYVFVAEPLRSLHFSHNEIDVLSIGVLLLLWIATALLYPLLHKFSVWLVDTVILKRISYENLQHEIAQNIEKRETIEAVLNEVRVNLSTALTAGKTSWTESSKTSAGANLPTVDFSPHRAVVFIPTNEAPFYKIYLKNFTGGRRLLSDEVSMLEAVSFLTARRIDALRVTHERCEQEIREQEFTKLTAEAQLTALRSQINPHFLFNALTTIGYLIQTAPETAFETLIKLTRLLRGVLRSNDEFCTLGEELKLIENYLDIEKARFEERLMVELDVPGDLQKLRVPALILQPLVENAIKHGISENNKGGLVKISARLENREAEVFLRLSVVDTGAGELKKHSARSNGIGLQNIEGRLKSYYGRKAGLKLQKDQKKGMEAVIYFPVRSVGREG